MQDLAGHRQRILPPFPLNKRVSHRGSLAKKAWLFKNISFHPQPPILFPQAMQFRLFRRLMALPRKGDGLDLPQLRFQGRSKRGHLVGRSDASQACLTSNRYARG